ncbi:MAG: isocitrate/isopropylmalate dehydrogenase family protein [Thaumarchaeota archaeon]|nr:isocitrate/isopropylmalate dehydrogenase family protein [Nitrososphaerota archaeon]
MYRVAFAEGDGIGPEVVPVAVRCVREAAEGSVELFRVDVGWSAYRSRGSSLPRDSLDAISAADGLILGPLDVGSYPPGDPGSPSPSGRIRRALDLYANIRPIRSPPWSARQFDLVIVRENVEGMYADRNMHAGSGEFMPSPDVALAIRVVTRRGCRRILRVGFELASSRRGGLALAHKANVLRMSDGMMVEEARSMAASYPGVRYSEALVDALAYELAVDPGRFDVIVAPNEWGDVLSNEAAGLAGSLGLAPSLNAGDSFAMAQAVHGSAPDIAGRGVANPVAMVLSAAMLLEWISSRRGDRRLLEASASIRAAVDGVLSDRDPGVLTPDLGGHGSTSSMESAICSRLARGR